MSELEWVIASSSNNSTSPKQRFASCPAGKKVVGGGAAIISGLNAPVAVSDSSPNEDLTAWGATGSEIIATATNWQVIAEAVCAKVS